MASPAPERVLELQVGRMMQLFDALDPAPFRERDLDPKAETYIVDWAREVEVGAPLALEVRLEREAATGEGRAMLTGAIHAHFAHCATATRLELKRLFRRGRISLAIGLAFLAAAIAVGEFLATFASKERYQLIITETFVIGGWVALWEPIQIFLYGWWPLRSEARLFDRLARMKVNVEARS